MICTIHPHSSPETARACYSSRVRRRLDKRLGGQEQWLTRTKYTQIKCMPPEIHQMGKMEVIYFYKGVPKNDYSSK